MHPLAGCCFSVSVQQKRFSVIFFRPNTIVLSGALASKTEREIDARALAAAALTRRARHESEIYLNE